MKNTTFIDNSGHPLGLSHNCHDGNGPFYIRDLIAPLGEGERQFIKYIHEDIIPPGSDFGYHTHTDERPSEEWYLCLEGNGIMELDGEEIPMKPGDISMCRSNGSHGIRNEGHGDLRILVIYASAIEQREGE